MSGTTFKRATRVGQQLQQELGRILVDGLNDPRVGFVTVTEVRLSDDLRNAHVYISVYGEDAQRQETMKGIEEAAGFLRREVGRRLKLRFTPRMTFSLDTTLDTAQRLETVINAIAHGDTELPDTDTPPEIAPVDTQRSAMAESARHFDENRPQPPKSRKRAARTKKRRFR